MMKLIKRIKVSLKRLFSIKDTPSNLAGGAAVGLFFAIMPGEGVFTSLIIATLFKLNRMTTLISVGATNTWSTLALAPLAAIIGARIFHLDAAGIINDFQAVYASRQWLDISRLLIFELAWPLLVGFLAVSAACSLMCYLVVYTLANKRNN
ncbi:MAG: DUF2062 domain-containing protein [Candidatus Falkowbacteria bacterium]